MRAFLIALLLAVDVSAATLQVELSRNGFAGPVEVSIATRDETHAPQWSSAKTLTGAQSSVQFDDVAPGLYVVLASGREPLQRLSAKANVSKDGARVRLTIPRSTTTIRVALGEEPLAGAAVSLTHDELLWETELTTGLDGSYTGALWEPGLYRVRVLRDRTAAASISEARLIPEFVPITVPDRHITGRVTNEEGKPVGNAMVILQTQSESETLTTRALSAPDGRYEFFGVHGGAQSLTARAPSYLQSDAISFDLTKAPATRSADFVLSHGATRMVRVLDTHAQPIANASLLTSCGGHLKSTTVTDADGRANVATPRSESCAVYALPKEGSIGVAQMSSRGQNVVIRVPAGSSSLKLALRSESGDAFADLWLLMRIDGMVVPPAIARQMVAKGLPLVTDGEGRIALTHIPPGTYEFWPYRNEAEGRMLYDVAADYAAPISVNVLTGENDVTVRFKARR